MKNKAKGWLLVCIFLPVVLLGVFLDGIGGAIQEVGEWIGDNVIKWSEKVGEKIGFIKK